MLGTLLDRTRMIVSPAARRRARELSANRAAHEEKARRLERAYEAARKDRRHARWNPPNRSADLELLADAATIRARARDLVRNNSYAQGIIRARLRNIVGCGIIPQARVSDNSGAPVETLNQSIETLWQRWQKRADVSGRLSFYEIQRLALREVDEAGEVLVQFVRSPDRSRPIPLALEMIEADRLADDRMFPRGINARTGNEVRRGLEIDPRTGEPVAYWIYPRHPQDINVLRPIPERIPASNVLHLFRQERVGQTRGVSIFAPVVRRMRDTEFYLENELTASAVRACFAAAIKTMAGEADGGLADDADDDATDSDGNTFEYLQPGIVARLLPGEEVQTINPNQSAGSAEPWIQLLVRSMGIGTGLSYERIARDYSRTNFSSNRASDLEDRREFRPEQDWLIGQLCEPVWLRFLEAAVLAELLPISATELLSDHERVTAHVWQAPGWEWVDPQKEAVASAVALRNNLTTLSDELAKRGKDLREVLEQRQREKELLAKFGLTEQTDVPGIPTAVETDEPAEPAENDGDGGETNRMALRELQLAN